VSASPEKKNPTKAERDEKRRQEEQKDRRTTAIYSVVAVAVVVAALALMVWNSGLLQRNLTALDVNGVKYTVADMQYYYSSVYNEQAQQYLFNSTQSVKKQVYDEATGQSWYDHLMDLAVESLTNSTALAAQARSEGFSLTEESQSQLDSFLSQLNTAWVGQTTSREALIRANYGPYMTYDRLVELVEQELLASDYAQSKLDAIDHPDADYDAYYREHADELDTVTYTYFLFRASLPATDADGNTIERTDAETAAQMEDAKAEQKALAEELKSKLEGGADPETLAEEYKNQMYSSSLSAHSTGSGLSYYPYGDWLLDSARKAGDTDLFERDYTSSCNYYVIVYEGRALVREPAHDVRHILIQAGDGVNPTQAEYDEAETKAQSVLDEWKAGEATEDSFAALVNANTSDTASASSGGLYSNITVSSNYEQAFLDWATDPARKEGDTGLVKTGYGWHVMYYVASKDPVWKQTTASALQNQDYEALTASASQGWTISRGVGMNFISA
jgi:hypothetical protein